MSFRRVPSQSLSLSLKRMKLAEYNDECVGKTRVLRSLEPVPWCSAVSAILGNLSKQTAASRTARLEN